VSVAQPNSNPTLDPISDQSLNVGEARDVPYNASDPDGDALTPLAQSSDNNIVSAAIYNAGTVSLTANNPGNATITVTVDDGRGGSASVSFNVAVAQPNSNPTIDPISDQSLNVGESLDAPYNASDPDGDPLTPLAQSSDPNIVSAAINNPGAVTLTANNPGNATITVSVDDGRGGTASVSFNVAVAAATSNQPPANVGPNVDISALPLVTSIEGDVLNTLRSIYQSGQGMSPAPNPGIFSAVGDVPPGQLMADLGDGTGDFGDLADAGELGNLVFYYVSTALPEGGNSFQSGGALGSNPNWRAADLLDPANADPSFCSGASPLECELTVNQPAIVFVMVGRNDVLSGTPLDQFQNSLQTIVQTIVNHGAIPVLTTIPGDPAAVPAINDYNSVIATIAADDHLPLINVWRWAMSASNTMIAPDLTLTSPGPTDQFTRDALDNFGAPGRNLLILRELVAIKNAVPIP
jgi:hypothetical protein